MQHITNITLITICLIATSMMITNAKQSQEPKSTFEVSELEQGKSGRFSFTNPHASHYFQGPTAIPLGKRNGYLKSTYLVLNAVNYGVTDNISFGVGTELVTSLASVGEAFYYGRNAQATIYITTQASYNVAENLHLGGGLIYINVAESNMAGDRRIIGYGIATYGNLNTTSLVL